MQLVAWTICSSCCEAHLAKLACPRCTGTTPRAAAKRVEIPAAAQVPVHRPAPRIERAAPDRGQSKKVPVGQILSVLVFFTGLALAGLALMPALGIILCAIPVVVQAVLRTRERRAERQGLAANLGLRLE